MKVLAIPDTHAPFHHPACLDWLAGVKRRFRPAAVVHLGDLGDQHGWSRHDRSPEAPGPVEELSQARKFVSDLCKLFPRVHACIGNHDDRVAKQSARVGIPAELVAGIAETYQTPRGWLWAPYHVLDGVLYTHGDGYSGPDCQIRAARDHRRSVVIGHIHSQGCVRYLAGPLDRIFGASAGCLVDPASPGMAYARRSPSKPVLGCLLVVDCVPQFLPMEV